jgi:integrase
VLVRALAPLIDDATLRRIGQELASGRTVTRGPKSITITRLCRLYMVHARDYYRCADGRRTTEATTIEMALRPLRKLQGRTPVNDFGPLRLKRVREAMIQMDWCRKHVNAQVGRIKRMFKWAVENELIAPGIFQAIQAVGGLRLGRSAARESLPVKPVPEPLIEAVLPHMAAQVRAMVQLQLLTGMRPGEVTTMRTTDVDTSVQPWRYTPAHHKTKHHGHQRVVFLGPKSQEVIRPFLKPEAPEAYLFSPIDAERERRAQIHARRKTPMSCGNTPGHGKRRPRRTPGEFYKTCAYARSIAYACGRAFPAPEGLEPETAKAWQRQHHWHPHQLRHNAATRLRKEFGIDIAQVVLGHKTLAVTQVYAEKDVEKAAKTMLQAG